MSEFPILHDNQPTASDLKNQLAEIINDNPVTLETIGTHADDVLTKLITFIDSVTVHMTNSLLLIWTYLRIPRMLLLNIMS